MKQDNKYKVKIIIDGHQVEAALLKPDDVTLLLNFIKNIKLEGEKLKDGK